MRVTRPAVLILLTLVASGCGDSSESPTQPTNIPSVVGTWTGTYHVKTCTESPLLPVAAQVCPGLTAATAPATQPVTMTLVQSEGTLTGSMSLGGWLGTTTGTGATAVTTPLVLLLTGTVDRGGTLLIQASVTTPVSACATTTFRTTVTNLNTTLNREKNGMTLGTFQLATRRFIAATTNGCSFNDITIDGDQFTVALPGAPPPTTTTRP